MKREAVLVEILRRRRLGITLVLTGLAFIVLFAAGLFYSIKVNGAGPSCRKSPLIEEKSRIKAMSCVADGALGGEKSLLLIPFAIAGGGLAAAGAGVLLYPIRLSAPQRARDATWDAFEPRAELDLGPALTR